MKCDKNCLHCALPACIYDLPKDKQKPVRHKRTKEQIAEQQHQYYLAHKEEIQARNRERYLANKEERIERAKKYYLEHKDEIKKRRTTRKEKI